MDPKKSGKNPELIGVEEARKVLEKPVREVEQEVAFRRELTRAKFLVNKLAPTRQGQKINPHLEIRNSALLLFQKRLLKHLGEKIHTPQDLERMRALLEKVEKENATPSADLQKMSQPFPADIGLGTILEKEVRAMEAGKPFFGNTAPGGLEEKPAEKEEELSGSRKVRRTKVLEHRAKFYPSSEEGMSSEK